MKLIDKVVKKIMRKLKICAENLWGTTSQMQGRMTNE